MEPAPLVLDHFLPYRLSIVASIISRLFANTYEERFGLTIPEWRVLAVIAEKGTLTTREVIDRTRMDRVRVSRAVIRMSSRGMISQLTQPRDQRAQVLKLAPKGRALYRQIVPLARSIQAELEAVLTPADRAQLDATLDKLRDCAERLSSHATSRQRKTSRLAT